MIYINVYLVNQAESFTFHFPVNPFNLEIDHEKKYSTVEIVDVGEVDVPDKGTKIEKISFDTFFPVEYDESYCTHKDIPNPQGVMIMLNKWMKQQAPLRLIIDDSAVNELVIIDTMPEKENAGEPGDKYVTMNFRTYNEMKVEMVKPVDSTITPTTTLKSNRSEPAKDDSKTYIVKEGDTLWGISKWWWADGSKWPDLYNKNKSVIGSNPNLIYPGQKLVFP